MAKFEDGVNSAILGGVDNAFKAQRSSMRPPEALGYYRWSGVSGLVTAVAASGELAQFRWSDASNVALIQWLRVRFVLTTAFTLAQEMIVEALPCTAWSAAGSGGTRITPTATSLMKRSSFPQSKVAANDIGISTTGALTAGTKTIGGTAIIAQHGWAGAVGATVIDVICDMSDGGAEYPLVLLQNEGLIIRNGATAMGAVGVGKLSVEIGWAEMSLAQFPGY